MNKSENVSEISLIDAQPAFYDFIIYSIAAVFGILSNSLLVYAIHKHLGHFGQRATFTFLVKYLCIIDLILCILIPFDMIIVTQVHDVLFYYEFFSHPRNVVLAFESLVLLFISIDRYMAIKFPFSSRWTLYFVYKVLGLLSAIVVLIDITIFVETYCCSRTVQIYGIFTNIFMYIVILCLILLLTYIFYFLVFVSFYRHAQYMNSNLPMRHVGPSTTAGKDHESEETNLQENTEADHTSSSSNYIKLARVLISVTLVYTVSIIPHILIGVDVIAFPGYIIYNLFYINAVVNPFILLVTDAKLRDDIQARFRVVVKKENGQMEQTCQTHTVYNEA